MPEKSHSVPSMHDDHRDWHSEHSMWQQDIDVWSKQLERGYDDLETAKQLMMNLQEEIRNHRLKIEERESNLQAHELDLARCEKLGLEYQENLTILHLETGKQFEQAREEHARLKRYHHRLMAKLENLAKSKMESEEKIR